MFQFVTRSIARLIVTVIIVITLLSYFVLCVFALHLVDRLAAVVFSGPCVY